jgi:hypothetical protein
MDPRNEEKENVNWVNLLSSTGVEGVERSYFNRYVMRALVKS